MHRSVRQNITNSLELKLASHASNKYAEEREHGDAGENKQQDGVLSRKEIPVNEMLHVKERP